MTASSRVVIGVPLYNHESHVEEALESLASQTFRNAAFVLCDDGSKDRTLDIARRFASADARFTVRSNETRLGYIGNAMRCYQLAAELYPNAEYFAWGSDHDVWHPRWLSRLVRELDGAPAAVLAYSGSFLIDGAGRAVSRDDTRYRPEQAQETVDRFRSVFRGVPMGSAVYGLFRLSALRRMPGLRPHLLADRLLLTELSMFGEIRPVDEFLFYRRYRQLFARKRQIAASFPGRKPLYLSLPWWLTHSAVLLRTYALSRESPPGVGRAVGVRCAAAYLADGIRVDIRRARRLMLARLRDFRPASPGLPPETRPGGRDNRGGAAE